MFSYEEYYKFLNGPAESRYQADKEALKKQCSEIKDSQDKGFRERMMRYSKKAAEYLLFLLKVEETRDEEFLHTAALKEMDEQMTTLYGFMLDGHYTSDIAGTTYMNTQARDVGPVLAQFTAEFVKGAEDALKHRRFLLADKIELYLEMHKRISRGQVRAEQLSALMREHISKKAELMQELRFHETFSPLDETNTLIVKENNLEEPYYLYAFGLPVGEQEKGYQKLLRDVDESVLKNTAEKLTDGFIAGMVKDTMNRPYRRYNNYDRSDNGENREDYVYEPEMVRNVVAIDYPMGMERLVREVILALEAKGYVPFVRKVSSACWSQVGLRDHEGDVYRNLDRAHMEKHVAITETIIKDNKAVLKSYAGAIRIVNPEEDAYFKMQEELRKTRNQGGKVIRPIGRYSVGAAEEKRKNYRDYILEEMSAYRKSGAMEGTSLVTLTVPSYKEEEGYAMKMEDWMKFSLKEHHAERSLKAFCDAIDRGSFLYLEGGKEMNGQGEEVQNETDLLVALGMLKNPAKETKAQAGNLSGSFPAGGVYTIPQKSETNGVLHLVHTTIEGVEFNNLRLTFEDGVLVDYSCDGFEDAEEAKRFIRDKLLHGGFEAELCEMTLGTHSRDWDKDYAPDLYHILPETMREAFDISIVLGESRMERDDFPRMNPVTKKQLVLPIEPDQLEENEEKKDAPAKEAVTAASTQEAVALEDSAVKTEAPVEAIAEEGKTEKEAPEAEHKEEDTKRKEEHRRRYGYPLRKRISFAYDKVGSLKVINENGSFNDIYRGNTFVLIGTDQLNIMKYKK